MASVAEAARHLADPRVKLLVEWIRQNLLEPKVPTNPASTPAWNRRRVLVFTEFTDTMRYLATQLRSALGRVDRDGTRIDDRIAVFHGGLGDETREDLKAAFNAESDDHPLRILIATDSAREGAGEPLRRSREAPRRPPRRRHPPLRGRLPRAPPRGRVAQRARAPRH